MNKIIIKGRLARNPETKQTNNGKNVCNFSVAVNRRMNKDEADFFECTAWEKTGEFVTKYFTKGQEILIEGRMESRNYDDKNGNKRIAWGVTVEQVDFCGNKSSGNNSSYSAPTEPTVASDLNNFEEEVSTTGVPF
jgi:single-strand DNA-binding protein